nr:probable LRR receptor-like serine/threonine-protein kinase At5g59680 [Oryza sativa Japonica Group]
MALLVSFVVFVLAAAHGAVGQPGFLSIDCGLDGNYSSGYKDPDEGITYVPDGTYVDAGENHRVAADRESGRLRSDLTVRSFPSGVRNCYALPTVAGAKYLVRVIAFYGNYDGKNSSSLQFDLYLGVNYWNTVSADGDEVYEAMFVAWASWAPVCLVNTGGGTPFVSSVNLRTLGSGVYHPVLAANQSMCLFDRRNMGSNVSILRYPDDPYDRYWWKMRSDPTWKNLSTASTIEQNDNFVVPLPVMQTAIEASNNDTIIKVTRKDKTAHKCMIFAYLADFQNSQLRQFNITLSDTKPLLYSPPYLSAGIVDISDWDMPNNGMYTITLEPTSASKLPPMLNAFEIYTLIPSDNPMTFPRDFDIIMSIKLEYGIKKNWMGDPCFPAAWDGVKCSNPSDNTSRIISLDLSNSNLHGPISNNFTLFTALEHLNLAGNQLNGPIPDSLCRKNNTGTFLLSFDSDRDTCNKSIPGINPSPPKSKVNRAAILAISVVVPVMAIVVLVLAYLIWRQKRKRDISADVPHSEPELEIAPASRKYHEDGLQRVENRRFTYKELEKITNKFSQCIGQGGFGLVYYGCLEDGTEVAVKMRSELSSHGLDEFLAEVQSLTKVHHRNLVSLIGYCWEMDHLALVYEYMSQGTLYDHLRGNNGARETLSWRTRVRVVVEAAQGLDYLHKGCSLPIIHRDVKTQNILLGQNLQAKIADFGLCKTYLSDTQTHISVAPAGSAGYMDPEYYHTGRLTESSDVYSFGVVLLEIVTGESPMLPGLGHVVQRVKKKIDAGNISLVADARLIGAYDVSSMWKVVDIALLCTADIGAHRPTMAAVVVQLKESLALEEARADSGFKGSIGTLSDTTISTSTFGPSAR